MLTKLALVVFTKYDIYHTFSFLLKFNQINYAIPFNF